MFISHPHFYNADPSLVDAVEGLHPSKEQHGLFLDVHPVSEPPGSPGTSPARGDPAISRGLAPLCSRGADPSRFQSAKTGEGMCR